MLEELKNVQSNSKESRFRKLDTTKPVRVRLLKIEIPPKDYEFTDKGQKQYILKVFNLDTQQEEDKWVHASHTIFVGLASLEADENDEFVITPLKVKSKFGSYTKYEVEKLN